MMRYPETATVRRLNDSWDARQRAAHRHLTRARRSNGYLATLAGAGFAAGVAVTVICKLIGMVAP